MKRIILILLSILFIFAFTACGNKKCEPNKHVYDGDCDAVCNKCGEERAIEHAWKSADCTAPKTCGNCGATEGAALGHSWSEATCDAPKTCTVCGTTAGAALSHVWKAATCETPKTCTLCKATEGEALGHQPHEDDGSDLQDLWQGDGARKIRAHPA